MTYDHNVKLLNLFTEMSFFSFEIFNLISAQATRLESRIIKSHYMYVDINSLRVEKGTEATRLVNHLFSLLPINHYGGIFTLFGLPLWLVTGVLLLESQSLDD